MATLAVKHSGKGLTTVLHAVYQLRQVFSGKRSPVKSISTIYKIFCIYKHAGWLKPT